MVMRVINAKLLDGYAKFIVDKNTHLLGIKIESFIQSEQMDNETSQIMLQNVLAQAKQLGISYAKMNAWAYLPKQTALSSSACDDSKKIICVWEKFGFRHDIPSYLKEELPEKLQKDELINILGNPEGKAWFDKYALKMRGAIFDFQKNPQLIDRFVQSAILAG
jgi:hypothetical protein